MLFCPLQNDWERLKIGVGVVCCRCRRHGHGLDDGDKVSKYSSAVLISFDTKYPFSFPISISIP
jgi:hypothetical protein